MSSSQLMVWDTQHNNSSIVILPIIILGKFHILQVYTINYLPLGCIVSKYSQETRTNSEFRYECFKCLLNCVPTDNVKA